MTSALDMFSKNGYYETNIRELSEQLQLSKAAMYKHFKSKEDLLNQLVDRLEKYYSEKFNLPLQNRQVPSNLEEFKEIVLNMLNFTINDETVIKIRKFIIKEQFRDERFSKLATMHNMTSIENVFSALFENMMKNDLIKKDDPHELAFEFYAPITLLIQLIDRDPSQKTVVYEQINKHIDRFIRNYSYNEKGKSNVKN